MEQHNRPGEKYVFLIWGWTVLSYVAPVPFLLRWVKNVWKRVTGHLVTSRKSLPGSAKLRPERGLIRQKEMKTPVWLCQWCGGALNPPPQSKRTLWSKMKWDHYALVRHAEVRSLLLAVSVALKWLQQIFTKPLFISQFWRFDTAMIMGTITNPSLMLCPCCSESQRLEINVLLPEARTESCPSLMFKQHLLSMLKDCSRSKRFSTQYPKDKIIRFYEEGLVWEPDPYFYRGNHSWGDSDHVG